MKKLISLTTACLCGLVLVACGNTNQSKENASLKAENSSLKAKSSSKAMSSMKAENESLKKQTTSSSSSNNNSPMNVNDVANKFAQLQNIDQNNVNIYVHPTEDPDVFKVYIKAKDSDPSIDSLIDHYIFNVKTNSITQANSRD